MASFYTDEYKRLLQDTEDACACAQSHPSSSLSSEVASVQNSINNIDFSKINGDLGVSYDATLATVKRQLSLIKDCVDAGLGKAESLYSSLKNHLEVLRDLDKKYDIILGNEPQKDDNKNNYNELHWDWSLARNRVAALCKDEQSTIKKIINNLEAINGLSIDGSFVKTVQKYKTYEINNNNFEEYFNMLSAEYLYKKLTKKVDIEKLGYTKEQVINELMNNPKADKKVNYILKYIPDNFNDLIVPLNLCQEDLSQYGIKENYLKNNNVYKETFNIGGHDFDIFWSNKKENNDFFGILESQLTKTIAINTVAHYPTTFLDTIALSGKDGNNATLFLNTSDPNPENSKKQFGTITNGTYAYNDNSTVSVNNIDSNVAYNYIHVLNHEFAHKFNDYYLDSGQGGQYVSKMYHDEFATALEDEYLSISKNCYSKYGYGDMKNFDIGRDGHNLKTYIDKNNYSEVFSECFDAYMRYGEEMKVTAPKTYEFYHKLVGDAEVHEIKVNGNLISANSEDSLIYGNGKKG